MYICVAEVMKPCFAVINVLCVSDYPEKNFKSQRDYEPKGPLVSLSVVVCVFLSQQLSKD